MDEEKMNNTSEKNKAEEHSEEKTVIFSPVSDDKVVPVADFSLESETDASVANLKENDDTMMKTEEEHISGLSLARSLCDAVINAGDNDGFHGGIRPDNILIIDGVVSLGSPLKHNVGEFTPQELEYMAPELFWDGIRMPSGDVYSIGLVLYSLYNYGRLPFWPTTGSITPNVRAAALQKRMSDEPLELPENADDQLGSIILRALAFRTEDRWTDPEELKLALNLCKAEDSPIDVESAINGLMNRSMETKDAGSNISKAKTFDDDTTSIPHNSSKPKRHRNFSWFWIVVLLAFIIGAIILLLSDCGGKKANMASSPVATAEPSEFTPVPTEEPTPTPEPTPTATPAPVGPKYVVYIEDVSWNEAVQRCEELGGKLAVPTTRQEYETIVGLCNDAEVVYVWLGASRGEDNNWFSPDKEEVIFEFNYWGDGEPSFVDGGDGVAEDYLLLWNVNGRWYANDSREDPLENFAGIYGGKIGFVCQMY